jgi:hypothetical protein
MTTPQLLILIATIVALACCAALIEMVRGRVR